MVHESPQALVLPSTLHQVSGHFQRAAATDLVHRSPQALVLPSPLHQVSGHFRPAAATDLVHESPQSLILPSPLHQVSGHFRSAAAADLVHESPQNLIPPFPLHQVFGFQFSVYDVTWCFTSRKPLFLRPQAPRLSDPMGFRRPGLGAKTPASPYSFVEGHHVLRSGWADALTDVVLHRPKSLVSSSGGTTSLSPDGPTPSLTWCFTSRKPLFLRGGAPRPSLRMNRLPY